MATEDQLAAFVVAAASSGGGRPFRFAKVTATPFFGGMQIQFAHDPAEAAPPLIGGVPYNVSGYASPVVGDVVLVAMVDGSPFVLCKSSLSP